MGCCCSCGEREHDGVQLQPQQRIVISAASEGVKVTNHLEVSGRGLAIASEPIEQDFSYWELCIKAMPEEAVVGAGVCRNAPLEELAAEDFGAGRLTWGFKTSSAGVSLKKGDVLGVAFSLSDMPAMQFFLNGEAITGTEIGRVRAGGEVSPAFFLRQGAVIEAVFNPEDFSHRPPNARFTELIISQSML